MKLGLLAALAALVPFAARADEGLWTFEAFPAAKVKAAYGVDITPAWLAKVQAASVRLSVGCSGALVSPDGLVFTNSHCISDCAQAISPKGADDLQDGFLAPTRPEEKTCPGLEADILESTEDVSAKLAARLSGLSSAALVKARDAAVNDVVQQGCGADPKLYCQVMILYRGGRYELYRYRKYTDVRLVFTPSSRAAFFGGDPDNYNFPRYDLDIAFLRLYEDGKPISSPGHLIWSPAPPTAGEPLLVPGNPGSTLRDATVVELETQRDVVIPLSMAELSELRGRVIRFGEESEAHRRAAASDLDLLENDIKVRFGDVAALDDPAFMAAKRAAEADLEAKATAKFGAKLGDPWADLERVAAQDRALWPAYRAFEMGPYDSKLFDAARILVRAAAEREKPSGARLPEYADSELPAVKTSLLEPEPVDPDLEQLMLETWLSKARERLGVDEPAIQRLLGKESPEALSKRLVAGSRLADPAVLKALWDGGEKAVEASDDPMIQFMRRMDPDARRLRADYEDKVAGPTAAAEATIAQARFQLFGEAAYPDGTFSLRLSYGQVRGWTYEGRTVGPFTTFAGLYQRATGAPPFDLDAKWVAARSGLNPDTILNFVTDNDIIGGNSGSPMLTAKAEVIGAAFDGNILSIGGNYGFDERVNRTVAVTTAAATEALRKIYHAEALLVELGVGS